jgi:hypothetical protein
MTTLQLANHAMAKSYTAISRQGTSFSTRMSIRRLLILAARRCVVRIFGVNIFSLGSLIYLTLDS